MAEPSLDDHQEAFADWWKAQGDTSGESLYAIAKRAYFSGAAYGSQCVAAAYKEAVKDIGNGKS
jgi:hypothetical protein